RVRIANPALASRKRSWPGQRGRTEAFSLMLPAIPGRHTYRKLGGRRKRYRSDGWAAVRLEFGQTALQGRHRRLRAVFHAEPLKNNVDVPFHGALGNAQSFADPLVAEPRSEERRVGKECRSRWSP